MVDTGLVVGEGDVVSVSVVVVSAVEVDEGGNDVCVAVVTVGTVDVVGGIEQP